MDTNTTNIKTAALRAQKSKEKTEIAMEKLNKAIADAEGKATVRRITAEDICVMLTEVEKILGYKSKKMLKGVTICCDVNAQRFPRAYKYVPSSTNFDAVHNGREWIITDIYRARCTTAKIYITRPDGSKTVVRSR